MVLALVLLGVGLVTQGVGSLLALSGAVLLVVFATQALVLAAMLRWVRRQEVQRPRPLGGPGPSDTGAGETGVPPTADRPTAP